MKKWEYKIVMVGGIPSGELIIHDGEATPPYSAAIILADLGEHGWELTGTANISSPSTQRSYLFFKREKGLK